MHLRLLVVSVVCILVIGCGSLQHDKTQLTHYEKRGIEKNNIKKQLYGQFLVWRGVPYQYGGLNKQGIDCSGFVYITYKSIFGIELPRTTKLQSQTGIEVKKSNLKTGDLIFFKTGLRTRHVGIYLENNQFMHASQSNGVMISNLDNRYWQSSYWKSIRI